MFTGIVEEIGTIRDVERWQGAARLGVNCSLVTAGARAGDSINVNGCCLTVTTLDDRGFVADLMGETLDRTALGDLGAGDSVNLEQALRVDGRLGGHVVQGHVDGVGEVLAVDKQHEWTVMAFSLPPALMPYVVEKGSIAVDGVSLTVMTVDDIRFRVGLIPHTLAVTILGRRRARDRVNLEVDIIAKYVRSMLAPYRDAAASLRDPQDRAATASLRERQDRAATASLRERQRRQKE